MSGCSGDALSCSPWPPVGKWIHLCFQRPGWLRAFSDGPGVCGAPRHIFSDCHGARWGLVAFDMLGRCLGAALLRTKLDGGTSFVVMCGKHAEGRFCAR